MVANSVSSIFEVLKGEVVDIVDYADDYCKKARRPLRLAVNASSWWYANNMTTAVVQRIRDTTREGVDANPIESNLLRYALRILHLGVQLHFVFDGPKRLSNGGKIFPGHDLPSLLYQETLTNMGIPWHEAPAEAEAECAKMEMENFVDGVWSEDGDALAFGCQTLVRFYYKNKSSADGREDTRKSFTQFRVYRLEKLVRQYPGMDRDGFIFHAILNGRPSDIKELGKLGPRDVIDAAENGLGRSLRAAAGSREGLRTWATTDLAGYLKDIGSDIEIPPEFPQWEHVQDYVNPVTSDSQMFSDLPKPRDPFLDEKATFFFLARKFQWTIRQWVELAIPLRIVWSLIATEIGEESKHDCLRLNWDFKKNKNPKKVKAEFLLSKATNLDISTLDETKGELETLKWILLKSKRSIASWLTTPPQSDTKVKVVARPSYSGKSTWPSKNEAGLNPLTPAFGSAWRSNGEGSSRRTGSRSMRKNTPPSPTPASKNRALPSVLDSLISEDSEPPPAVDCRTLNQMREEGKGKGNEVATSSNTNGKRNRSPADSRSPNKELCDKRARLCVEQPPSTPPAQIIAPADVTPGPLVIDLESSEDGEALNNPIVIDSDSDEDPYGSFPSLSDLPTELEDAGTKAIQDDAMSSSGDDYGSFPSTPDLLALT